MFGLAGAWLWQRDYRNSWNRFMRQPGLVMLSACYLVFLAGMLYTSNFKYGLHDLKIKLPLLLLPFFVGASPLPGQKEQRWILHALLFSLVGCCILGVLIYLRIVPWKVEDVRQYSPFISSIRFSTLLVFAIATCAWLTARRQQSWRLLHPLLYAVMAVFFLGFILLLKSMTGLVALFVTAWVLLVYAAWQQRRVVWRIAAVLFALAMPASLALYLKQEIHAYYQMETVDMEHLPRLTPGGHPYKHLLTPEVENGHYIWLYICEEELEAEWNKRSAIPFTGLDKKGYRIYSTLISYLTSKGLRKDAQGVQALTDADIRHVEAGITNYRYASPLNIGGRIYQLIWEYDRYQKFEDPTGLSFMTRLEHWKAGWGEVQRSPWYGYGTGDVRDALREGYVRIHSRLDPRFWVNPHQQYLSIALATGCLGLAIFLVLFFSPLARWRQYSFLLIGFICITVVAMLDDDPLETQAGVTQIAFLYSLLISGMFPDAKPDKA